LEVTKGASNITTISIHDEQWNSPPETSFWKSVKHWNISWLYFRLRPLCFSLYYCTCQKLELDAVLFILSGLVTGKWEHHHPQDEPRHDAGKPTSTV
jgi:hypothetical protein